MSRDSDQANQRPDGPASLYVTNLPEELNKDGLMEIFQLYGKITILAPPKAKWAFVSYSTYKEAEHAVRNLNNRGPLFLKVMFQQKKHKQYQGTRDIRYQAPPETLSKDFRYADIEIIPGRGGMKSELLAAQAARFSTCHCEVDENCIYPSELDHNIYNPFESVGRYANTNAMWSRGCMNIDDQGKRFVSMGRGFTRYYIPEPNPNLEEQIGRVCDSRRAGFYEYGEGHVESELGNCQLCMRVATSRCELCSGFYCSTRCQRADWSRHKLECQMLAFRRANLTRRPKEISLSSSENEMALTQPGSMDLKSLGVLQRSIGSAQRIQSRKGDVSEETANRTLVDMNCAPLGEDIHCKRKEKSLPVQLMPSEQRVGKVSVNYKDFRNVEKNHRIDENSNCKMQNKNKGQNSKDPGGGKMSDLTTRELRKIEDELAFRKKPFENVGPNSQNLIKGIVRSPENYPRVNPMDSLLAKQRLTKQEDDILLNEKGEITPRDLEKVCKSMPAASLFSKAEFTDVIIVCLAADGSFWVHREKDNKEFEKMMLQLHSDSELYPRVQDLYQDEIYTTRFNDYWHRVVLVSKSPLRVFFIDFGNENPPETRDFRSLRDFPTYPPFAVKMRFSGDKKLRTLEENVKLSVRLVGVDENGVLEVVEKSEIENISKNAYDAPDRDSLTAMTYAAIKTSNSTEKLPQTTSKPLENKMASPHAQNVSSTASAALKTTTVLGRASSSASATSVKPFNQKKDPREPENTDPTSTNISDNLKNNKKFISDAPNVLDTLNLSTIAYIQACMTLSNNSISGSILNPKLDIEYDKIYNVLTETCNKSCEKMLTNPQIGDYVCGKREEVWLRGYVSSVGPPVRLALVDEARVSPVDQICPMPEEFSKICHFGAICTFDSSDKCLKVDEVANFTVASIETESGQRIVRAVLESPEHLKNSQITLKKWSPTVEQEGVAFAELRPNSRVVIRAFASERIMFVQSQDEKSLERSHRLLQEVAKWSQKAPKLDRPPAVGELVIAKFADGNFYRAIVTKIQEEKIGVSFVDYGNPDFVRVEDVRQLSQELKEEKSCVSKILLKDIRSDVPPTQMAHKYLNFLVGKERPLICIFEGIPSKDGVILCSPGGDSHISKLAKDSKTVNDKVNEYMTPSWHLQDPLKTTDCFTEMDIEYSNLGNVGQLAKVLVLYETNVPFHYYMCSSDFERFSHIMGTMPEMLKRYCEEAKQHYIPRAAELCVAFYEGAWYRGLCLNPSQTPIQAQILFIDFGNIDCVDHKDIRLFTRDFLAPAALGCMVTVQNPGIELINGEIPQGIKNTMDSLIATNDTIEVKIVKKVEDGEYVVEVPLLREKLLKEGFLKQ